LFPPLLAHPHEHYLPCPSTTTILRHMPHIQWNNLSIQPQSASLNRPTGNQQDATGKKSSIESIFAGQELGRVNMVTYGLHMI
jgi:hypothetical protein